MKALLLTIAALTAALSLAVSLGSASAANGSTATGTKVAVASSRLGNILVDGRGHTLYLFAKDRHGKSGCTSQCAAFWPPLVAAGKPRAAAGAKASLLGTTKRPDGRLQVTYNHHPSTPSSRTRRRGRQTARNSTSSAPSGTPSQLPEPRSKSPTQPAATAATRPRAATAPATRRHRHTRRGPPHSSGPLLTRTQSTDISAPPEPDLWALACASVLSREQRPPASMIGVRTPRASCPIRSTYGPEPPSCRKQRVRFRSGHAHQP